MSKNILCIHHSSLIVKDTQHSLKFYCSILGFNLLDRPDFPYFGAWLDLGEQQLHLLELDNPDPITGRPAHGGKDRHVAFHVLNLDLIKQALEQGKVAYTLSVSGRKALFCRDPDGNALEFIEKPEF
ncbi:MAG: VOC family protein [Methylococcales bacterium]|nr:VOC family protein [Methylococcales bacterium]